MASRPTSIVANVVSIKSKRGIRGLPNRLPWEDGVGTLCMKGAFHHVQGLIPIAPASLRFRFTYYPNSSGTGYLQSYDRGRPKLDCRSIRLTAKRLESDVGIDFHGDLESRKETLFINFYCVVDFDMALARAREFDEAHGTPCRFLVDALKRAVELVTQRDHDCPYGKMLLVAQMYPLFRSVYNVDFLDIMLVPFGTLLNIFVGMHKTGPIVAFERKMFAFDIFGFPRVTGGRKESAKQKKKAGPPLPPVQTSIRYDDAADSENEVADEAARRLEVVLHLKFRRAWDLYSKQVQMNRADVAIDGDEEAEEKKGDADEEEEEKEKHAGTTGTLDSLFLSGTKRPAPKSGGGGVHDKLGKSFDVKASDAEDAAVLLSTNGGSTVGVPMDMRKLTNEQWIELMVVEVLTDNFATKLHFGLPHSDMVDMQRIAADRTDFPVRPVTTELVTKVLMDMVRKSKLRVVDLDCGVYMMSEELEKTFPNGTLLAAPQPNLFFGLPWIVDQEEKLAAAVAEFLGRDDALAETRERMRTSGSRPDLPRDIELAREQVQALAYASVLPLVFVNGPGGTGKSLVMRLDYERLRLANPAGVVACLAFKNDTVNQMRHALAPHKDDPDVADHRLFFRTVDSFNYTEGYLVWKNSEGVSEYVEPEFLIVDEAGMLSTSHMKDMFLNIGAVKQIKMFGDGDQLPPIMAGAPFPALMAALPGLTVTLRRNFRTSFAPTLMNYMTAIRERNFASEDTRIFDDLASELRVFGTPGAGSSFHVRDVEYTREDSKLVFGAKILEVLAKVDPDRTRYGDIMCVTPYNYMAEFVSVLMDLIYIAKSPHPLNDAVTISNNDRAPPTLYVGSWVVVVKTDEHNKQLAQGRVARLTHIVDHERNKTFDLSVPLPPYIFSKKSTAERMPYRWQRTLVLDGRTVATFNSDAAVTALIRPSACRTIHRAQGCQSPIVFCLFPTGRMSNIAVWYTGVSRAQRQCVTFATDETILTMMTTEPEKCHTALPAFLASETSTVVNLPEMQRLAVATDEAAQTVVDLTDEALDDDDDDDAPVDMEKFDAAMANILA